VPLPFAHHLRRAGASRGRLASHAEDDLLGERDPDLFVVDELVVLLEGLDRPSARVGIAIRVELQPVALADASVPVGPELRPWPEEGEVDIEKDGLQHRGRG
jgi:hypothetical protein